MDTRPTMDKRSRRRLKLIGLLSAALIQRKFTACRLNALTVKERTRNMVFDRGSRSDRPRYHANARWTPPLPLAKAVAEAVAKAT